MDTHLNLFNFFGGSETEYYENNLSRSFALCLKNDGMFLDHVLRHVLDSNCYNQIFNIDNPPEQLWVDLQIPAESLSGYKQVVAVSCSGKETFLSDETQGRSTEKPITDVVISLNEICIIFEFKRTDEDCSAQLKRQAEAVKEACDNSSEIKYKDLCWPTIIEIALRVLSIQKHAGRENSFTSDFVSFIEFKHPRWFPERCLASIPLPKDKDDPNQQHLERRLRQLALKTAGGEDGVVQTGGRYAVKVDFGWANEVNISHKLGDEFLLIQIWAGDTKGQGRSLFVDGRVFNWPDKIVNYDFAVDSYLKFAHFNRGICSIHPVAEQARLTHSHTFFSEFAGRVKLDKWDEFSKKLNRIIPDWEVEKDWSGATFKQCFRDTGRQYFDFSPGFVLSVKIPYDDAKKRDQNLDRSALDLEFNKIIDGMKRCVDQK